MGQIQTLEAQMYALRGSDNEHPQEKADRLELPTSETVDCGISWRLSSGSENNAALSALREELAVLRVELAHAQQQPSEAPPEYSRDG